MPKHQITRRRFNPNWNDCWRARHWTRQYFLLRLFVLLDPLPHKVRIYSMLQCKPRNPSARLKAGGNNARLPGRVITTTAIRVDGDNSGLLSLQTHIQVSTSNPGGHLILHHTLQMKVRKNARLRKPALRGRTLYGSSVTQRI
jgi:hypothetical protein